MQTALYTQTLYSQLKAEIEKHPHLLEAYKTDLTVHDKKNINSLPVGAEVYIMAYDHGTHSAIHPDSASDGKRWEAKQAFTILYRHMVLEEKKDVRCYYLTVREKRLGRAYGQIKEISAEEFAKIGLPNP